VLPHDPAIALMAVEQNEACSPARASARLCICWRKGHGQRTARPA